MCMGSETVKLGMRVKQATGSHFALEEGERLDQHQHLCRARIVEGEGRRITRSPPPRRHHSPPARASPHPSASRSPNQAPTRDIAHLASPVPPLLFAPRTCSRLQSVVQSPVLVSCRVVYHVYQYPWQHSTYVGQVGSSPTQLSNPPERERERVRRQHRARWSQSSQSSQLDV